MQEHEGNPIHCILIDDDQDDIEIFKLAIAQTGLKIKFQSARDGVRGLELLNSLTSSPDFIFLDLNMPNLDGKQTLVEIRKQKKFTDTPVIIYSTSSYINDIRETSRLGATGFVTKPNNIDSLVEILTSIFNNTYAFKTSAYYK